MITETFAPVNFPIDGSELGPMLIFKDITPIYLKVNFLKWCEIGLAEVGISRQLEKKVITHVHLEFVGLIDAVYFIAASMLDEDKMEEHLQQYIANYYKKDAKEEDIPPPPDLCLVFFKGITYKSAKSILWLLMEVVTANKDKYEYQREQKDILNLYERYSAVIDIGHDWRNKMKEYYRLKKKSGSKKRKNKKR
jgi:hypothetical protein